MVSFVYRNAPRDRDRSGIHVSEIGYGSGSNLWFAAREGFRVSGIEGSEAAVRMAVDRFESDGLSGDLRVGLFPELPWDDGTVDLLIDRGALTCVGFDLARQTLRECHRVLAAGGRMYFTPYSSMNSSAEYGRDCEDGCRRDISGGPMQGVGSICFYDSEQVVDVIGEGWQVVQFEHLLSEDRVKNDGRFAVWRLVLEKN
ncbi:MAG: class I SAM-dependent methyltransferase [Actinomycetota bacterium]|nr:class I SAM-dependent methyltransferase [Actinomycetota bacterium]MEC9128487.1 class I SAM-dependent methyltransferase [Actinomycetota bacterium]